MFVPEVLLYIINYFTEAQGLPQGNNIIMGYI